jgi:hypothetical protein
MSDTLRRTEVCRRQALAATLLLWLPLALGWLPCAAGESLLKNGDFAQEAAGKPTVPADWTLPPDASWQRLLGPDGKAFLQYKAAAGVQAPARGACDFLAPKAGYTVQVALEGDGALTPVVRLLDLPDNVELARLSGTRTLGPQRLGVTFTTVSANVGIEVYADVAQVDGKPGPAGLLKLTQVRVLPVFAAAPEKLPDLGPNLALRQPYTLDPAPNYALCKDPADATQLTDGVYTEGHFWTRPSTVGWFNNMAFITVDLQRDQPIRGISYNTAAGVAQVQWPLRVLVFVSPDGRQWYEAGNLVTLNAPHKNLPEYGQYAVRRLWTDQLATHGRYVCLCVEPPYGGFVFVDEIEVFKGADELLQKPYAGLAFTTPKASLEKSMQDELLRTQFERELQAVRKSIADGLPEGARGPLLAEADRLAARIAAYEAPDLTGFRAVLPICELEAAVFKLQAAAWRAMQRPALMVWTKHRWEMLEPGEGPATLDPPPPVDVHLMNNEWRAGVFNLTNAAAEDVKVGVKVTGLPGGDNPGYLTVHEVLTVGTRRFVPVSAALPVVAREGDRYPVTIPAGMTRQVWLSFKPDNLPAQTHTGQIEITPPTGPMQTLALRLVVYPLRFPDQTTLLLGGWDYTDADSMYGITVQNKAAVVTHLKEHYVNTPWAGGGVMWSVQVDEQGQIKQPADTSRFDRWVKLWPEAKRYMVFLMAGDSFAGAKMGTPQFDLAVGNWSRFWAQHMRDLGLNPAQLGVLIYDEPGAKKQYDLIVAWAKAIEAAAPEIVTWEDPQPTEFVDAPVMFAAVDEICPYRNPFLAREPLYREMFFTAQKQGKTLWFYNADGPARTFDPFSFYLVQEWQAFAINAKGSHFWAFGDSGGVSCWNEYPAKGSGPYCPSYLDETSVTTSKYMEAIREGVQDFEYLTLLQKRVAELEAQGGKQPELAAAKALLVSGPQRVLAGEKGANYRWDEAKDRTVQDQVRIEVLKTLVALAKP